MLNTSTQLVGNNGRAGLFKSLGNLLDKLQDVCVCVAREIKSYLVWYWPCSSTWGSLLCSQAAHTHTFTHTHTCSCTLTCLCKQHTSASTHTHILYSHSHTAAVLEYSHYWLTLSPFLPPSLCLSLSLSLSLYSIQWALLALNSKYSYCQSNDGITEIFININHNLIHTYISYTHIQRDTR